VEPIDAFDHRPIVRVLLTSQAVNALQAMQSNGRENAGKVVINAFTIRVLAREAPIASTRSDTGPGIRRNCTAHCSKASVLFRPRRHRPWSGIRLGLVRDHNGSLTLDGNRAGAQVHDSPAILSETPDLASPDQWSGDLARGQNPTATTAPERTQQFCNFVPITACILPAIRIRDTHLAAVGLHATVAQLDRKHQDYESGAEGCRNLPSVHQSLLFQEKKLHLANTS